ncbi:winged helix-turn-helix domain-containing protein [Hymenobacter coccineus]|uniref:ModE family transcriptional regulator n=1 Tax=Hymenobacter coccineus TaxID=1908235 RepID=A0A1G1TIV6_9BACT|nr:LysR family transcriptional regulator [Hymenobacter coccineus]OGX90798.1 ModE family transcriptional regulator [Hymenobacter coccineus]
MKDLLPAPADYRLEGRVWVQGPHDRFLGIGRLELLAQIQATGSISRAAAAMGMSYKRAWDLVHSMNTQALAPLVATQTGGKSGGGALLTSAGSQAVADFQGVQTRFQAFLAEETRRLAE